MISAGTGNWSSASTWKLCSVAAENDSEAANATLTTGNLDSSTFVLEANQIDAFAVKVQARPGSTGTVTLTLRNSTTATNVASITLNTTDFDSNGNGWYVIPLGLTLTPNGTDAYLIRATASAGSLLTLYSSATNNWSRQVRRTATQAPVANDKCFVAGEHTGAGTGNSFTVTFDNTAVTSFGPVVSGGPPQGMTVNKRGTLTFGVTASAAYYLQWKGILAVYGSGTLSVGTSGARMPSSSSAVLEMASVSNVDSGLNIFPGGIFNAYGDNSRIPNTLLTADKAIAATVMTLAATTGWVAGDVLAFASTTRTAADCESKVILTVDSATQVTLTAGLTAAHSGTSPTQAEVINLTRNVKIRGVSATLQGYCVFQTTSTVNIDYIEFTQLGSATASKTGIDCTTTTGTCSLTHCSLHDSTVTSSIGFNSTGTSGQTASTLIFSNNVTYNVANSHLQIAGTSGAWTADSNIFIKNSSGNLVVINDAGGVFTNNTIVGATSLGVNIAEAADLGTFSNVTAHSCSSSGVTINSVSNGAITALSVWRNGNLGFVLTSPRSVTITALTAFGNVNSNISFNNASDILFTGCLLASDTTFGTTSGAGLGNAGLISDIIFESCTFGVTAGIFTAHGNDIACGTAYGTCLLHNCLLASTTEVSSQSSLQPGSYIRSQRHDQTAGLHRTWTRTGTISIDAVIFDAASPSVRLTPLSATSKLATDGGAVDGKGGFFVPVSNGSTVTVSVRVRQSILADGTAYNGNLPRLVLRKNVAAGIAADVVLATATSASSGAWQTISGTTAAVTDDCVLSFVVDCDGSGGWVNVDTWNAPGQDTSGVKFWSEGEPFAGATAGGAILSRAFLGMGGA